MWKLALFAWNNGIYCINKKVDNCADLITNTGDSGGCVYDINPSQTLLTNIDCKQSKWISQKVLN